MHREFSSSYEAKFVIEQDKMYIENANRAIKTGEITPDNLEPTSKNPIIASFFRNIGRTDRLGSGVRNLYKYCEFYSGKKPKFIENDIFKIIVPLDNSFSYDFESQPQYVAEEMPNNTRKVPNSANKVPNNKLNKQRMIILQSLSHKGKITTKEVEKLLSVKERRARIILTELVKEGILLKQGTTRSTNYILNERKDIL